MDMEFLSEVRVFFLCGLSGICCGIVYDFIRIIRRIFKPGTVLVLMLDILFWILCAIFTFCMLFFVNYGRVRWYEWFAIAIGAGAYFLSASPMVTEGGTMFFKLLLKLLKFVTAPLFSLIKVIFALFGRFKGKISEKIVKNRLTTARFWFKIKKKMVFYRKYLKK